MVMHHRQSPIPRGPGRMAHPVLNAIGRSSDFQALPVGGAYSARLPSLVFPRPVLIERTSGSSLRVSFLITAAGQFRIHTGFPLSVPGTQDPGANQRRKNTGTGGGLSIARGTVQPRGTRRVSARGHRDQRLVGPIFRASWPKLYPGFSGIV